MSRTFLQLMQQAANELGIPEPSAIVSNSDDVSKQLLALAQREGKEFSALANSNGGWQNLHKEYVFYTEIVSEVGNTTSGSSSITSLNDTTDYAADTWEISGTGITSGTKISSIDSASAITIDSKATATGTDIALTVSKIGYALPSDFEYFANRTQWSAAQSWELLGPITAQEKQVLRYGITNSTPYSRWYVKNNKIFLNPAPTAANDKLAFDYYSNYWCESSGGTAQARWTADSDVYKLDEDCFVLGMIWRYRRAKGLDYGQEKYDYDNECQRVMARDSGCRTLSLNGGTNGAELLSDENIPEVGYGR